LAGTYQPGIATAIQAANDFLEGVTGKGKTRNFGGTLFFPAGTYWCDTGLRIGDMVRWVGSQLSATSLLWTDAFSGNAITIGPDMAHGGNQPDGRFGIYAMGATIEDILVECGANTQWGIYTTGAQQNCCIRNVWVTNVCKQGGIFIQDHQ